MANNPHVCFGLFTKNSKRNSEGRGTVNHASPIIREIFQRALQHFAVSIICVHNHPAGEVAPSSEDKAFTYKLIESGRVIGVNVLDHIILGDGKSYSFQDNGLICYK